MSRGSSIEWCHHTFNPWWGCTRVSEACMVCYAESFSKRVGHRVWGPKAERRFFRDAHWREPERWHRHAQLHRARERVFCASMADVFEDRPDLVAPRARLLRLIEATPWLDWLLLTKRPENMVPLAAGAWPAAWPANVWAGTTAENRARMRERLRHLEQVPAARLFLSCEPLYEPLDVAEAAYAGVSWMIFGCESRGARVGSLGSADSEVAWRSDVATQVAACQARGIAAFVKQVPVGGRIEKDPAAWPEPWLRVREFPGEVAAA